MTAEQDNASAVDEAAKLAAALGRWLNDHVATDHDACQACPVCQLIVRVRQRQPEVADHLVIAVDALLAAARAALLASEREWTSERPPSVQRIDIAE